MKRGNPQGKGLTPILDAWRSVQPGTCVSKSPQRILSDYFVTLLILSSEFAFKPVPGVSYFLYLRDERWELSLIGPEEWRDLRRRHCLGRCTLQGDMTWSLEILGEPERIPVLQNALGAFHDGFLTLLTDHPTLEDSLPHYVDHLPYYRRLLAAGLANSLAQSLSLGKLRKQGSDYWLQAAGAITLLKYSG
jgi:hypothetical protein